MNDSCEPILNLIFDEEKTNVTLTLREVYYEYAELHAPPKEEREKVEKERKKSNNTKYTGKEFVKIINGTALAHIGGHHIVCIKDNKVLDTWDSTDGCIGNYWIKED